MLEDDDVKQKGRDAGRHLGEHLAAAVRAGFHEHVSVHPGAAEADVTEAEEVDEADHGARGDRQGGAPGRAVRTQTEHADEDVIEDDVQHEPGHRHPESDLRTAVGPHEVLEKQLEGHRDAAEEDDPCVRQNMREQTLTTAEEVADRPEEDEAENRKQNREDKQDQGDEGENLIRLTVLFLSHFFANDGARTGCKHHGGSEDDAGHRNHDVDARERVGTRVLRDEVAVDRRVEGQEDHGQHGRNQILQELRVGHVVFKTVHFSSAYRVLRGLSAASVWTVSCFVRWCSHRALDKHSLFLGYP